MGFSFWAPWNFCTKFQASPSNRCQPGLIIWFQAAVQKYESYWRDCFQNLQKCANRKALWFLFIHFDKHVRWHLHECQQVTFLQTTETSHADICSVSRWHYILICHLSYPTSHRHLGSFTVIFVVYISQVVRDRLRPWLWRPNQVFQAKPLFFSDPNQVGFLRKPNQSAGEKQNIQPTQT